MYYLVNCDMYYMVSSRRWESTLYPSCADANPHVGFALKDRGAEIFVSSKANNYKTIHNTILVERNSIQQI